MEKLIYDRTQMDVDLDTPKGNYNFSDLNRVEKWCEYLSDLLNKYLYNNIIYVKTDWKMPELMTAQNSPTVSQMERIRTNLIALRNAYFTFTTTPSTPDDLDFMTFQKANDVEKIIFDIDKVLEFMENNFIFCGVPNGGQNRIWQKRFRKMKTWNAQPYKLIQYLNTDKLSMIATDDAQSIASKTKILDLAGIDKRDDVFASIKATNDSMQTIDNLVGFECKEYNLVNLVKAIENESFVVDGGTVPCEKSTVHVKYGANSLLITGDDGDNEKYGVSTTSYSLEPTHLYYACVEVYSETGNGSIDFFWKSASPSFFGGKKVYANTWTKWSIVSNRSNFTAGNYPYRLDFNNGGIADKAWFDGVMIIDLTETFGAGNEPTQDWCDKNIPYFTGTYTHKEPVEPYTEIEYLQSSGTQYIDTGVAGNNDNLEIAVEYKMLGFKSYSGVFGNYTAEADNCWRIIQTNTDNDKYYLNTNTKGGGGTITISMPKNVIHKVVMNKNAIIVDGVEYATSSNKGTENSSNIVLFRQKATNASSIMQLYSCKMYDNGVLIRNYIPVEDKNGIYCLFDRVTKEFFYNKGTGNFIGAEGYEKLTYLSNPNAQYIDTEYIPNGTLTMKATILQPIENAGKEQAFWGSTNQHLEFAFSTTQNRIFLYSYISARYTSDDSIYDKVFDVEGVVSNNSPYKILRLSLDGGIEVKSTDKNHGDWNTSTILLFACGVENKYNFLGRIYTASLYDDNNLVRDFIPVKDANGVCCMFDKVTKQFFYSQGTGNFGGE